MFQYLSRMKFIKYVSIVAIVVFISFGMIRFARDTFFLGILDFTLALILLANWLLLLKRGTLRLASHILVTIFVSSSLFLFFSGGIESTGYTPLFAVPLFVYFLVGKKDALLWLVPYSLLVFISIILMTFDVLDTSYSHAVLRETLIFYLLIFWISHLFESLNYKSQLQIKQQSNALKAYNKELTNTIDEKTSQIKALKDNVSIAVEREVRRNKTKDQIYLQQSQQYKIAEMLGMVADQWREPLSYIASVMHNTRLMINNDKASLTSIDDGLKSVEVTLDELSEIISSFRSFYQPSMDKEYFFIHLSIKNSLMIMEKSLEQANIDLNLWLDDSLEVTGFKSEFEQVILNLISNAKRALLTNAIKDPWIQIIAKEEIIDEISYACISIKDNGLGIKENKLEEIFSVNAQRHSMDDNNIGL
ncbi:MAG: HAMP domain-containing histidine kinase, partial [Thiovulaceae bacterium]|nr:HAMP domain-containing histidine kinase [Sulfurimonadaceae bacterium]